MEGMKKSLRRLEIRRRAISNDELELIAGLESLESLSHICLVFSLELLTGL